MDDETRPIENTRQAYVEAAKLGVGFVECDVHLTLDGKVVLSHDYTISGSKTMSGRETPQIKDMLWEDLEKVQLKCGSYPVLLNTVLADLVKARAQGAKSKLALEIKTERASKAIAELFTSQPELYGALGFVMSFSFPALETFK